MKLDTATVVSTWNNREANSIAIESLNRFPDKLLDAIENAVNSVENNPNDTSVGYGGYPDNTGIVTLDACIMDKDGNAGSVCYLKDIQNAVSVARKVMEETPHVILAGDGAKQFAVSQGFESNNLLTEAATMAYEKWREKSLYAPKINAERHDTIGLLAQSIDGDLSGACSTSGLAYKMPGRVGDSPIIGAGLYVDNDHGAATATGMGELMLQSCSSFLVVELMSRGYSPIEACKAAIERIQRKLNVNNQQVGLIAINKSGDVGGFALRKGFNYAVSKGNHFQLIESEFLF